MRKGLFVMIVCLSLLITPAVVFANGLPNWAIQHGPNGIITPLQKVPISVEREILNIDLVKKPITVEANYTLKNPESDNVSIQILFPVAPNGDAKVVYNGEPVESIHPNYESTIPEQDSRILEYWIDPYINQPYIPNSIERVGSAVELLAFTVSLKPQETSTLQVTYKQSPSYDPTRLIRQPLDRFDYLLLPAKHWAGFRNLEINLLVPDTVQLASNLHFEKTATNLQFKSNGLPEENLSIFYVPKKNLVNGVVSSLYTRPYYTFVIAGVIIFLFLTTLIFKRLYARQKVG